MTSLGGDVNPEESHFPGHLFLFPPPPPAQLFLRTLARLISCSHTVVLSSNLQAESFSSINRGDSPSHQLRLSHLHRSYGPSSANQCAPRRENSKTCDHSSIRELAHLLPLKLVDMFQGWFVGHATLLIAVGRYALSYITFNYYSRWAQFSYRLAFVSAVATYGIVVFKAYRSRFKAGTKPQAMAMQLLADENVQYLRESMQSDLIVAPN